MYFERDSERVQEIELEDRSCRIARALIAEWAVPRDFNLTPAQSDLLETYLAKYWLQTEEIKLTFSLDKYSFLKQVPFLSWLFDRQVRKLGITASAAGHLNESAERKALLMDEDPTMIYLKYLQKRNLIQDGSLEDLSEQIRGFDPKLVHNFSKPVGRSLGIEETARKLSKVFFRDSLDCLGRSRDIDPKLV